MKSASPVWDLGIPGLLIRRGTTTLGNDCWSIDHAESGAAILWFYDPETASKVLLADLAQLTNWKRSAKDLQADHALQDKVMAIGRANNAQAGCERGKWSDA